MEWGKLKVFYYKLLNSTTTNKNTVHSLVKKLNLINDYKVKQEGNFIILITKEKLNFFENSHQLDLEYHLNDENTTKITSTIFLILKEEKTIEEYKNYKNLKLKGQIVFNLAFLDEEDKKIKEELVKKEKEKTISLEEKNILKKLNKNRKFNLIERNDLKKEIVIFKSPDGEKKYFSFRNYQKEKQELEQKGFIFVKKIDENDNFEEYVKNFINKQCEKYGFEIDFYKSRFFEASSEEKIIYTSHKRKYNNHVFKLFNLINVELEILIIDQELFKTIQYNNVFAKKSYGCGFLEILG